jgi:hypothetical protein
MNQVMSFQGSDFINAMLARPKAGHSDNGRSRSATHRSEAPRAPIRVPMLDWPAQLFNDNATMTDLATEDYGAWCDLPAASAGKEIYAQAAA